VVVDGAANEQCSHCHCGVAIINISLAWLAKYVLSGFALHDFYDTHGPRTDRENDRGRHLRPCWFF